MKKKILSSVMALLLLAPYTANAAPVEYISSPSEGMIYDSAKTSEPTTKELEEVIKAAKPLFDIPQEYSEFSWDYFGGSAYSEPGWNLMWTTKRDAGFYGYAAITCDVNGRVKSFNLYSDAEKTSFPEYTKNELVDTAKAFIKKVAPDANLVFDKANDAYGRYSDGYSYTFKRIENGIEYPDNSASVTVDFSGGKVIHCNIVYDYDLEIDNPENLIGEEKAAGILGTQQKMTLSYSYLREKQKDGTYTNKAVLVYSPSESYVSVDAKTGEIYFDKAEVIGPTLNGSAADKNMTFDSVETEGSREEGYNLTEEELAKLAELNGLITKDEAIKKITDNKALHLDLSLTAIYAELTKTYANYDTKQEKYVWNISFSDPVGAEKYDYVYANAMVDAKSGEIIGFSSSLRSAYYYQQNEITPPLVKFNEEQCEKIVSDFIKANIPEKFENTQKSEVYPTNPIKYNEKITDGIVERTPVYGAYSFNYVRVNEGLAFNNNRIYATVDGVTGKISSYGYSWTDDLVFESVKDAMSADEAYKIYLELSQFDKYYERYDEFVFKTAESSTPEEKFRAFVVAIKQYTDEYEQIVAAYAPDMDKEKLKEAIVARDEDMIIKLASEYFGTEIPESDYFFDSLENLYDKNSVARLVYKSKEPSVRISALTGEKVNYSGKVIKTGYEGEYDDIEGHWAQRYITIMADIGILERAQSFNPDKYIEKEEFASIMSEAGMYYEAGESEITRFTAVKHIIDSLGYGKVASLTGIYRTEFKDNSEVDEKDIGYLAIAYGLGIINGDAGTGTFRPSERITKAEAVKLAVAAIVAAR
jgi:hypothetical protein